MQSISYRIVEKYCGDNKKVFICENGDGTFWRQMLTDKRETWYSTQYKSAIFNTYAEAEAFINNKKAKEPIIHNL